MFASSPFPFYCFLVFASRLFSLCCFNFLLLWLAPATFTFMADLNSCDFSSCGLQQFKFFPSWMAYDTLIISLAMAGLHCSCLFLLSWPALWSMAGPLINGQNPFFSWFHSFPVTGQAMYCFYWPFFRFCRGLTPFLCPHRSGEVSGLLQRLPAMDAPLCRVHLYFLHGRTILPRGSL